MSAIGVTTGTTTTVKAAKKARTARRGMPPQPQSTFTNNTATAGKPPPPTKVAKSVDKAATSKKRFTKVPSKSHLTKDEILYGGGK